MEVSDCWFDTGEVVDVVDGFCCVWGMVDEEVESFHDGVGGWDVERCVQVLSSVRAVEEDSVCVVVLDIVGEGNPPQFGDWAAITL